MNDAYDGFMRDSKRQPARHSNTVVWPVGYRGPQILSSFIMTLIL